MWNRIKRLVSNKPVSLLFRIALPALSVAVLFYTLETAQREQHAWIAGRERAARTPITNNKIESIPFVLPFQHGSRIQDAIGFQWPAFVAAGTIAPVPQLFYAQMEPVAFTRNSYVALAFAVGIYWFLIGVWIDSRFVQRNRPTYSPIIRGTYTIAFALTALWLVLFLGKDLLGGWPEGPHGAYGVTAWLALASTILMTEIKGSTNSARHNHS